MRMQYTLMLGEKEGNFEHCITIVGACITYNSQELTNINIILQ